MYLLLTTCKKDEITNPSSPTCYIDHSRMTYNQDIKPIIDTKCGINSNCHGNFSTHGSYMTYQGLDIVMSTGSFENRVFVLKNMPPTPLSKCDYNKLEYWYHQGHPQ